MDCASSKTQTPARTLPILAVCLPLLFVGCRSLRPGDNEGLFAIKDALSIENVAGPLERSLNRRSNEDPLAQGARFSTEGRRDVERARQLFDDKKYGEAARAYKRVAGRYENSCLLYTSPSPRDRTRSRMPSSA